MSSANAISTPTQSRRRFHARRRIEGLIYVDFGPDNGAILIDLGEGGLGFQSVVPVSLEQAILLKFKVPGDAEPIEGYAEVAWLNESGKGGGLRFVELSETARAQIRGWTGQLAAPEPLAAEAGSAESPSALQTPPEPPSAKAAEANSAHEVASSDTPVQISEAFAAGSAQPPSPEPPEVVPSVEVVREQTPASEDPWPGQSLLAQFVVGLSAEIPTTTPVAAQAEEAPPPISATPTAENRASESALPPEEGEEVHDLSSSEESAGGTSEIPAVSTAPERVAAPHTRSEISATPAPLQRMHAPDVTPEVAHPVAAPPAKPARPQSADAGNVAQAPKRPRKPSPSKPESSLTPSYRPDSSARGSTARQFPKPVSAGSEGETLLEIPEADLNPQPTLVSQALKIGIGAAAGVGLVLAIVFAVPSLRTLVQTTANARSAGLNLANAPAFQVEVADLDNRRWILRGGGDAGSPFADTPSRREAQPSAGRKESAKSHSDDSDASAETVTAPQPKQANPAELALSRPVPKTPAAPNAQILAPSIFDGITPPIGSLADNLPVSGPDMPGVVQPASPAAGRPSALQSAVLLQRVAPVYPVTALQAKVQGEVSVNATIGKDGVPKDLKLIKGDQRLVAAAFAAIRQWRYRPATLGGMPIETQTVVTVSFELK